MSVVSPAELEKLAQQSPDHLDRADYGVVQVDDGGGIIFYNRYESELAGLEPESVKGKNFFTQVAPCTNNRLFYGKFKDGVGKGELALSMPYTFTYKMRPTNVFVQLHHDGATSTNWVLVKKR